MSETTQRPRAQRVGAYALCLDGRGILLARFAAPDCRWSLPGGGVEHGEHPADAVVREVSEETGYAVAVRALLGVRSSIWHGRDADVHMFGIVYEVEVVGGTLRHETDGSTDQAGWFDLDDVRTLHRADGLDTGIDLYHRRPADGRSLL